MGAMYIETPYIIISRVISSHMRAMYIETPYIIITRVISSHMRALYIETPYIIISRFISSHMGAMYIETLNISFSYTDYCGNTKVFSRLYDLPIAGRGKERISSLSKRH